MDTPKHKYLINIDRNADLLRQWTLGEKMDLASMAFESLSPCQPSTDIHPITPLTHERPIPDQRKTKRVARHPCILAENVRFQFPMSGNCEVGLPRGSLSEEISFGVSFTYTVRNVEKNP